MIRPEELQEKKMWKSEITLWKDMKCEWFVWVEQSYATSTKLKAFKVTTRHLGWLEEQSDVEDRRSGLFKAFTKWWVWFSAREIHSVYWDVSKLSSDWCPVAASQSGKPFLWFMENLPPHTWTTEPRGWTCELGAVVTVTSSCSAISTTHPYRGFLHFSSLPTFNPDLLHGSPQ